MKLKALVFLLGLVLCGTATARRGINTDGWGFVSNGTGSSFSLNSSSPLPTGSFLPGGVSLSFAPGTSLDSYQIYGLGSTYDMFNWRGGPTAADGGYSTQEQVLVEVIHPNEFILQFNYADAGCAGETASLRVGNLTFSAANPCNYGVPTTGCTEGNPSPADECQYLENEFTFKIVKGKVQLVGPSPWANVASAPEIDPNSAVAGLTLLLGGIATLTGRRRCPRGGRHGQSHRAAVA